MGTPNKTNCQHRHNFCGEFSVAEKNTRRVLILNAAMMVIEVIGGVKLHSMALYADGWHMATHVTAFLITVGAYTLMRRQAESSLYSFGTGKIAVLGAFTSAIVLGGIAMFMAVQSVLRLIHPLPIHFNEAIGVACIGLTVNITSALMLKDHSHHPITDHGHQRHADLGRDLNLKAAYIHVLADAITSLLAITALTAGKWWGCARLDPIMGIVGGGVIAQWACSLIWETQVILLDKESPDSDLHRQIRAMIESNGDAVIIDLHIWQISPCKFAAIIALVARRPKSTEDYKALLKERTELVHITVEIHQAKDGPDQS